jgi:hypothetical protein
VTDADGEDLVIADARTLDVPDEVCDANAERIAHCWNCHEDLLAVCKIIAEEDTAPESGPCGALTALTRERLRAAIAKAEQR